MFKPQYTPLALIIGSLISPASFAGETITDNSNDDIVISASRVETKRVETGSSVTVINKQYLKENRNRTVAEILQDIPGVSVTNTGGLGKSTSVFIRGADSNKTLVVIDGVEVNDLSNISGGYGFQNLMADNIERIEVLRGSQSALWGSDAIGGVINIVTKQGKSGFNPTASVEIGENNYHKENVNISGAQGDTNYSLSVTNLETDGISARDNESDDDSYENKSIMLKAGHQFTDIFEMDTLLRYVDSESEYDGYSAVSDSGNYSTNKQYQAKINSHLNLLNQQWKNRLSVGLSNSKNEDFSSSDTSSEGKKIKTELQSDYYLKPVSNFTQRVSFFAEHENDNYQSWSMDEKERIEATGIVLGYGTDWQKLVFINAAIRHDFNNKFDDTTTYHLDASGWINEGTRLHSSYGTGVKNPTLGQLYGYQSFGYSAYTGNPNLTPEKSRSWDFGVEYNFSDVDAYVDLTYFDSRYTNMIDYESDSDFNGTYVNLDDDATARGLEFTGSLKLTQDFRLNTSYTYMKTDDGDGNELSRRPEHSASINANYKYTPKLSANIGFRYVGTRIDSDDSELDSYMLTNIAVAYQVHKHIGLSARLENAFNENYEEVSGYNTDDRTIYVGINFK